MRLQVERRDDLVWRHGVVPSAIGAATLDYLRCHLQQRRADEFNSAIARGSTIAPKIPRFEV
jgi:hypothetical protein